MGIIISIMILIFIIYGLIKIENMDAKYIEKKFKNDK